MSAHASDHSRWLAVVQRKRSSHCSFVYGVKSTKIYCRPTCNARLARRANITFFDTIDQAQLAGFRPCKRCKPNDEGFVGEQDELVTRTIELLRTGQYDQTTNHSLKDLAQKVGVTPSYLCRTFKKVMGITIGTYIREFEKDSSEEATIVPSGSQIWDEVPGEIGSIDLMDSTDWSWLDHHFDQFQPLNLTLTQTNDTSAIR